MTSPSPPGTEVDAAHDLGGNRLGARLFVPAPPEGIPTSEAGTHISASHADGRPAVQY